MGMNGIMSGMKGMFGPVGPDMCRLTMEGGIALIKTLIECKLFGIPFDVKFVKNCVAFIADFIPMVIGLGIAYKLKSKEYGLKV